MPQTVRPMGPLRPRKLALGAGTAGLLALLPFLAATQFLYPLGTHEWDYISNWGTADSFWEMQKYWYTHHSGRFSSTALLSTLPFWYTLPGFRLFALADLLLLPAGLYLLARAAAKPQGALLISGLWVLVYLHQLSSTFDSLLRFTCMPIYHFGAYGCWATAVLLGLYQKKGKGYILAAALLPAVYVTGSNEISLLHLLMLIAPIAFYAPSAQRRGLLLLAIIVLGFGAFSVLAPGNYERAAAYGSSTDWGRLIFLTGSTTLFLWAKWLADSLLLPLCLFFSLAWASFPQLRPQTGRAKPWAILLIALTPISLLPLLKGTAGESLPERVVDLLFLSNIILATGLLSSLMHLLPAAALKRSGRYLLLPVSAFLLLHAFGDGLAVNRANRTDASNYLALIQTSSPIGTAWLQYLGGGFHAYTREQEAVHRQIQSCTTDTCYVRPLRSTNFIGYDPLYDRLNREGGESFQPQALGKPGIKVLRYAPLNQ